VKNSYRSDQYPILKDDLRAGNEEHKAHLAEAPVIFNVFRIAVKCFDLGKKSNFYCLVLYGLFSSFAGGIE